MVDPQVELTPRSDVSGKERATLRGRAPRSVGWALVAGAAGETAAALGGAVILLPLSRLVSVNPLDRVGQVSGLAALQVMFALLAGVLLIALALVGRANRTASALAPRFVAAALAGLSSGLVAAGIAVALHGTSFPLFGNVGDSRQLQQWAEEISSGQSVSLGTYPPIFPYLLALVADVGGTEPALALKYLQIVITAVFGAVAYLTWRLVLPPAWALAVGVVAAAPLIEPYKPYVNLVLIALLPLLARFVIEIKACRVRSYPAVAMRGAALGILLGLLFLTYSGWFVWSGPGFAVALVLLLVTSRDRLRALTLAAAGGLTFFLIAGSHFLKLLTFAGQTKDDYFYFDTFVEPTYFAMWKDDLVSNPGVWPPPGELSGVGVFGLLLVVGFGLALATGASRGIVIAAGSCLASAWVLRFWFAANMYQDQSVQLYPRTSAQILYCLLVLSGTGVYFASLRVQPRPAPAMAMTTRSRDRWRWPTTHRTHFAVTAALVLLLAMAGSSKADQYMPRPEYSKGALAWVAHTQVKPDGSCSAYVPVAECSNQPFQNLGRASSDETTGG